MATEYSANADRTKLGTFEFYTNLDNFQKVHKARPIHASFEEEFEAESEYQRIKGIKRKFAIPDDAVLINDTHFFEKGKLLLKYADGREEVAKKRISGEEFEKICAYLDDLAQDTAFIGIDDDYYDEEIDDLVGF